MAPKLIGRRSRRLQISDGYHTVSYKWTGRDWMNWKSPGGAMYRALYGANNKYLIVYLFQVISGTVRWCQLKRRLKDHFGVTQWRRTLYLSCQREKIDVWVPEHFDQQWSCFFAWASFKERELIPGAKQGTSSSPAQLKWWTLYQSSEFPSHPWIKLRRNVL